MDSEEGITEGMTKQSNIADVKSLKQSLNEGEFRSLIDVILDGVGWLLRKLTRRSARPAQWVSAVVIALLISSTGLLISLLSGGVSQYGYRTLLLGFVVIFLTIMIPQSINQRTLATMHDQILDELDTSVGLPVLRGWLTALSSRIWPILFGVLFVSLNLAYGHFFLENVEAPIDVLVIGYAMFIIAGIMVYYLMLFLVLPGRLARCHFRLNAWDPASTEVVAQLSGLLNFIAYMIAFLLAAIAVFTVSLVTFDVTNLIIMIPMWLILIVIFVTGQLALSRIIKRAKRDSLHQVELQMEALRQAGDPPDQETMDIFMRTWDYYDRIKGTRDSVLDLRGILNLANTLLIPLLAFLVANRNEIFQLLGWID